MPSPHVFISYSHDSREHCDRVLALAQQLRRDGVDAELDQFHQEELKHWPRWCEERMRPENADFVLCICTAEYKNRVENRVEADVGKGVFWEGKLIYDELYDAKGNPRCVPVLLGDAKDADIPRVLKNYTWFLLDAFDVADDRSSYAKLFRLLTGQASLVAEALGPIAALSALPRLDRTKSFHDLIENLLGGIKQDTQTILRNQQVHQALLERIAQSARNYRSGALHQLKSPPQHFTGRAEPLAELLAALRTHPDSQAGEGGRAVVISTVNGLGGVGKTALAIMASYALLEDYPDLQLFLELGAHSANPRSAEQARDSVLQAVNPTARLPDDDSARWQMYRGLFYDHDSGKTMRGLVVLDDAADDAQVNKLAPPPGNALLVTSRQHLRTGRPLHLNRLPRAESKSLLRTYTHRLSDEQAGRLAALCGDLPVALKTAGGYLKAYPSTPIAEYLKELGEDRLQVLHNEEEPLDDVNLVFDASWRRLSEREHRAFASLSVMPADFDREAGKAVIKAGPEGSNVAKKLDRLVHLNLLEYDEESKRFGWHELLRVYSLARLPKDQADAARLAHAEHFIDIAWQVEALTKQCHKCLLQGLSIFDHVLAHFDAAFDFLSCDPEYSEQLIRLVHGVTYTSDLHFSPHKRILWSEAQLKAARRVKNQEQQAIALGNLGNAYWDLNEPCKAISYYRKQLVISRLISDLRGVGNALGGLGASYLNLGNLRKAIKYSMQYLAIARKIGNRRSEGIALDNLGVAFYKQQKLSQAIKYHEQALEITREIEDLPGEGNSLGNLGLAYAAQGKLQLAIEYHSKDLSIAREVGDRRSEGIALGDLGLAYEQLGETDKARGYFEQRLDIAREIDDRRSEGETLWSLALVHGKSSERAQAITLAQQALEIFEALEDTSAAKVRATLAQWLDGTA